jgi:hypothetical protein
MDTALLRFTDNWNLDSELITLLMKIVRIILLQYQNLLSTIMTIDEMDLKTLAKINRQCNIAPSLNSQSSDDLVSLDSK